METTWEGKFVVVSIVDLARESSLVASVMDAKISPEVISTACEGAAEVGRDHGYEFHHLFQSVHDGAFAVFTR